MLSDDPFVRQLEEEQETPRIQSCGWVWCRETFSGRPALNDHIISVHVNHKPVRRSDIPTLKQLEEAPIKTFDVIPKTLKPNLSSLPSSPTSSPLSLSSALQSSPTRDGPSVLCNHQPNNHGVDVHSTPLRTLNDAPGPSVAPFTPLKNAIAPKFASLSSPTDSDLYSPTIPESPDISKMIFDNGCNRDNSPSRSSSSSRESVVKQLTQSMEDCSSRSDNSSTELAKEAIRSQTQTHSVTMARFQSATHASAHVRRQTWYQGVPKSHLRTSKPCRARRIVTAISRSDGSSASGASGPSSTPEWSQIDTNSHPFPYQTQSPYDSQPMI